MVALVHDYRAQYSIVALPNIKLYRPPASHKKALFILYAATTLGLFHDLQPVMQR